MYEYRQTFSGVWLFPDPLSTLTGGLEESICQRTNTNLSALYLFLTYTRPPDFDTDHTTKTQIS
jgi:hypothetical protein